MAERPLNNGHHPNGQNNLLEKLKSELEKLIKEIREANIWIAIHKKDREKKD